MTIPQRLPTTAAFQRRAGSLLVCVCMACLLATAAWGAPGGMAHEGGTNMPGMEMPGGAAAAGRAWWAYWQVWAAAATVAGLVLLLLVGRVSKSQVLHSRYLSAIALLLLAYFMTSYVVDRHKRAGQMSLMESLGMDMSAMRAPEGAMPVATEVLNVGAFAPGVTYTGTVVAYNDEDVYPRVTGRIVSLPVYPGDQVRRGQLLVKLDDQELSARERQALFDREMAVAARRTSEREVEMAAAAHRQSEAEISGAVEDVKVMRQELAASEAMVKESESMAQQAERSIEAGRGEVQAAQAMQESAEAEIAMASAGVEGAEAEVASGKANVAYWEQEIKRMRQLKDAGAASLDELQMEEREYADAKAMLAQRQAMVTERKQGLSAAQARKRQAVADVSANEARLRAMEAELGKAQAGLERSHTEVRGAQARVQRAHADVRSKQAMRQEKAAGVRASTARTTEAAAAIAMGTAALTVARTVHGYTEIRASRPGHVIQRLVSPGVLVSPGTPILRVAEISRVRLQAYVSGSDLATIAVGNRIEARSAKLPNGVLEARVTSVFPAADPSSRTSVVEAVVDNPDMRLVPGDAVSLRFWAEETDGAITVPSSSIVYRTVPTGGPSSRQQATVWLAVGETASAAQKPSYTCVMHPEVHSDKPGKCPKCGMDLVPEKASAAPAAPAGPPDYTCVMHPEVHSDKPGKCPKCGMDLVPAKATAAGGVKKAHQVDVTLGATDGERTEVVSGLSAGDEVIVRGYQDLQEGMLVYSVPWTESGPLEMPPAPGSSGGAMENMPGMKM